MALIAFALVIGVGAINANPVTTANASECHKQMRQGISVVGTASVKVQPDFASISLNVETSSTNVEDALKENSSITQKLIEAFSNQGIAKDDITTSWFSIYPEYDYSLGHQSRETGHRVSNQLSVKVRNIDSVGKIIDLAAASGANIVSGVQFGIEDNYAAYNDSLTKAIDNAKQKAAVLAIEAGLDNLEIAFVKELSSHGHIGFARHDFAHPAYTQIMHDEIEITAMVKVVFKG